MKWCVLFLYFLNIVFFSGHYCPTGSSAPVACLAGNYQDETRKVSCKACIEGFYCPLGTTTPVSCPAGYYCEASQGVGTTNPCPTGKYNNNTERHQASHCLSCPPGWADEKYLKCTHYKSCFGVFERDITHDRVSEVSVNVPTKAFCPPMCFLFVSGESCFYTRLRI